MRQILEILRNDLRLFLIDRGNLIGLLVVPIVMTILIGLVSAGFFSGDDSVIIRVDIVDLDNSKLSAQFVADIQEANDILTLCPAKGDEDQACGLEGGATFDEDWARNRVETDASQAAVVIPPGYEEDVRAFLPVTVRYLSQEGTSAPGFIQQAVDAAIQRANGAVVASLVGSQVIASFTGAELDQAAQVSLQSGLYDRAASMWETPPVSVSYQLTSQIEAPSTLDTLQSGLGQSVPGIGSMFVMFTVFGGMTALIQERKQWTLQRLATLPISRAQLLSGKILARFALGLLQFLVVLLVGAALGMNFGRDPLALVLMVITYTLAITALSFALGSRLENETQASGLGLLLSLILAPLGGAWWPLEIVPDFMRLVGHLSPVAWAMDGFNALIFDQAGLGEVLIPLGILLALTLICFAIAIRLFRYE